MAAMTPLAAACSSSSPSQAGQAAAHTPIKVYFESDEQKGWEHVLANYNASSSAKLGKVTLEPVSSTSYETIMPRTLAAGTAADVIEVGPGNGNPATIDNLAPAGYLMDLSDEPWVKNVPSAILEVCKVNGKVYMIPDTGSGDVVFYNKKIFSDLNIIPPATYPEFLQVCAKLKAAGKIPMFLDLSQSLASGLFSIFVTYPLAATTNVADTDWPVLRKEGKVTFANSGWATSLTKYMQLFKAGYFSPDATGGAPLSQISSGQAAMMPAYPQGWSLYGPLFGDGNCGVIALPNADAASKVIAVAGSGYGLAVNAKTPNPAAAKAFLNTAATLDSQTELNSAIGGLPILPAGPTAVPAPFAGWVKIIRSGRAVPMFDQYWDNAEVQKALTTGTIDLMTGQATIPQVLHNMDDAYDAGAT